MMDHLKSFDIKNNSFINVVLILGDYYFFSVVVENYYKWNLELLFNTLLKFPIGECLH